MRNAQITMALFKETGTYNDVTSRPYQLNYDTQILGQFQEATQNGRFLTPENISGVAGSLLSPKAQHMGRVSIDNDWDAPRFRFMMKVVTRTNFGENIEVVTGYTDYVGANPSGAFDPNLRLYINNVIHLRSVQTFDPTVGRTVERYNVAEASHLLRGDYNPTFNTPYSAGGAPSSISMRPTDIFTRMTSMDLPEVNDTRLTFANGHKKSFRRNGSVPSYVSKILTSFKHVRNDDNFYSDYPDMIERARGMVKEGEVTTDAFLYALRMNSSTFDQSGYVTFGELGAFFPEIYSDEVSKVQFATGHLASVVHRRGSTESFEGANMETVASTTLGYSVPSLMMDLMLTRVAFKATNRILGQRYNVVLLDAHGFVDVDLSEPLDIFARRLEVEILEPMSMNNQIDFEITCMVDILGETSVTISLNNGPNIDYVIPSFSDALFSPVVTTQEEVLGDLAVGFEQLAGNMDTQHFDAVQQQTARTSSFGGFNGNNTAL